MSAVAVAPNVAVANHGSNANKLACSIFADKLCVFEHRLKAGLCWARHRRADVCILSMIAFVYFDPDHPSVSR